jgi:hypothetical protein
MAYSSSDFQGDVVNHMLELELLPHELADSDDLAATAHQVKSMISHLCTRRDRNESALKFHDELLLSVEARQCELPSDGDSARRQHRAVFEGRGTARNAPWFAVRRAVVEARHDR